MEIYPNIGSCQFYLLPIRNDKYSCDVSIRADGVSLVVSNKKEGIISNDSCDMVKEHCLNALRTELFLNTAPFKLIPGRSSLPSLSHDRAGVQCRLAFEIMPVDVCELSPVESK